MTNQIKSKQRVADHGEVLTAEREVNAMLDLVKQETERIDSRFLEPACGTGNFLVPILERKLEVIKKKYSKSKLEFERYSITAVGSIYGIDILEDNVEACRDRLYNVVNNLYTNLYKENCDEDFRKSIRHILKKNIILGDALTLKTVNNGDKPITFSEWSLVQGSMIKQRDFTFAEILKKESGFDRLLSFIDKTKDPFFIPEPIKEYPLTHYLKLSYATT